MSTVTRTAGACAGLVLVALGMALAWRSAHRSKERLAARAGDVAQAAESSADWPLAKTGRELAASASEAPRDRWSAAIAAGHDPQVLARWKAHASPVTSLAVSEDGSLVLSSSRDGSLASWTPDGILRAHVADVPAPIEAVALGPPGEAWTISADATIRRWDLGSARELEHVALPAAHATRARSGAGGALVAWTDSLGVIEVRPGEGAWRSRSEATAPGRDVLATSASGRRRCILEGASIVRLEDAATGAVHARFDTDQGSVTTAAMDASGSLLVTGGEDGSVRAWILPEWRRRRSLAWKSGEARRATPRPEDDDVRALAFQGDGTLQAATPDGRRRTWSDVDGDETIVRDGDARDAVVALAWDPVGQGLVAASGSGRVTVATPQGEWRWNAARAITAIAVDADAREIWTAEEDHLLSVRELAGGRELRRLGGHEARITSLQRSRTRRVFSGSLDGTVREWGDGPGGGDVLLRAAPVTSLAWSDELSLLVAGGADGALRAVAPATIVVQAAHEPSVEALAFRPGSRMLASAGADGLALWRVTPEGFTLLARDPEPAHALSWTPDGARLAVGGDGQVRVLDVPAGDEVPEPPDAVAARRDPPAQVRATVP